MKCIEVEVHNFLSFEHFKMSLDNQGVTLIEGKNSTSNRFNSNGSGKSSLLEPIVYALYDTTSKGLKADDVVNNKIKKGTAVILKVQKGEDVYRIERYRKHTKNKNKVKLFVNDQEITEKSTADTNAAIEKLVGIDYNTFVNSIMFSQGNGAGRFAIATDKEKKEILENLVNLEIYAKAQLVAKDRIKQKENELSAKEREIEKLNWDLEQVDKMEERDKENYQNTENMIAQEEAKIKELSDTMVKYSSDNISSKNESEEAIEQLKAQVEKAVGVDVSAENAAVSQAYNDLQAVTNEIKQVTFQKDQVVAQYKKLISDTHCPVCGTELDAAHREKEAAALKEKVRDFLVQINNLNQQCRPLENTYNEAVQRQSAVQAQAQEASRGYQELTRNIALHQKVIDAFAQTIQNYKNQIDNVKRNLESLRNFPKPSPRTAERKDIKAKIKACKEGLLAVQKEVTQLENVVKVYSNAGVKSHVLDLITPFLNTQANKYLSILSGPDMELQFTTQKQNKDGSLSDKFDVQLINHAGGDTYKSNSEGEKKRADLSISLAIQDLVLQKSDSSFNFVIYDEVFDALDSVGSENVVTLLKERQKIVGSIYVITHSEHLKPLFEKVITVVKNKQGISSIEEGEGTS